MDHQLQDFLNTAVNVAKKAGEVVKEAFYLEKSTKAKDSYADLVTETDQKVEKMIFAELREKYPTHRFIGEETSSADGEKPEWTKDPTWIVDPIDGTANFVHSITNTCVCIGLSIDRQVVVGVVYLPMTNHIYTAVKGQGAKCNGEKISVSKTKELISAVVYCEGGNAREPELVQKKMDTMRNIVLHSHGIRCLGSAAVNMCMVAQGSGDAYIEYGIHIWDIAASGLIVTEAGGVLLDPTGSDVDLQSRRVLCASSQPLAEELSKHLIHLTLERD